MEVPEGSTDSDATTAAGNFIHFRDVTGSALTVSATGDFATAGPLSAPINAIQIIELPPPTPAGADVTVTGTIDDTAAESNSLTIDAGTGGNVDLQGVVGGSESIAGLTIGNAANVDLPDVTLASGSSLTQTAGTGTTSVNGDIVTAGVGAVSLTTARNIVLPTGSSITTVNGGVTLSANAGNVTSGDFNGIELDDADIMTATGAVTLNGTGGDTGDANFGVFLHTGATITSTGVTPAGTITLNRRQRHHQCQRGSGWRRTRRGPGIDGGGECQHHRNRRHRQWNGLRCSRHHPA